MCFFLNKGMHLSLYKFTFWSILFIFQSSKSPFSVKVLIMHWHTIATQPNLTASTHPNMTPAWSDLPEIFSYEPMDQINRHQSMEKRNQWKYNQHRRQKNPVFLNHIQGQMLDQRAVLCSLWIALRTLLTTDCLLLVCVKHMLCVKNISSDESLSQDQCKDPMHCWSTQWQCYLTNPKCLDFMLCVKYLGISEIL